MACNEASMRILIYKRTHGGDPDPKSGVFGDHDCMGTVRARRYDAVIGIGGIGRESKSEGIAGKLTWVGIGPHQIFDDSDHRLSPRVTFDHFWYRGENGPLLERRYPALASHMYEKNRRVVMRSPSALIPDDLDRDIKKILRLAKDAPSSSKLRTVATGCMGSRFPRQVQNVCS
jgi:hypothetical protein